MNQLYESSLGKELWKRRWAKLILRNLKFQRSELVSGILCWTLAHRRHRNLLHFSWQSIDCINWPINARTGVTYARNGYCTNVLWTKSSPFWNKLQRICQLCSGDDASFGLSDGLCLVHTGPLSSIAASGPGGNVTTLAMYDCFKHMSTLLHILEAWYL